MKLRKLSVLILSSALFTGVASTSFAQQAHQDTGPARSNAAYSMQGDQIGQVAWASNDLYSENPGGFYGSAEQGSRGKTRAQVIADLNEARAKGQLEFTDSSYPVTVSQENGQMPAGKSREQVIAELTQANQLGLLSVSDSADPNQGYAGQGSAGSGATTKMAEGTSGNKDMC